MGVRAPTHTDFLVALNMFWTFGEFFSWGCCKGQAKRTLIHYPVEIGVGPKTYFVSNAFGGPHTSDL